MACSVSRGYHLIIPSNVEPLPPGLIQAVENTKTIACTTEEVRLCDVFLSWPGLCTVWPALVLFCRNGVFPAVVWVHHHKYSHKLAMPPAAGSWSLARQEHGGCSSTRNLSAWRWTPLLRLLEEFGFAGGGRFTPTPSRSQKHSQNPAGVLCFDARNFLVEHANLQV